MILKNFVPSTLEAVGFLCSYMSQFECKYVDLCVIKSKIEEDNFHHPGVIVVNRYFGILFFKDTASFL